MRERTDMNEPTHTEHVTEDAVRRDRLTAALTTTIMHVGMVVGVVLGRWDAGASVVGVLLDSLVAYVLWLGVYLYLRPRGGTKEVMAKTFVGLSLGVWGFIAMFKAVTVKDASILAVTWGILEGASHLGDIDGDAAGILLVILAAVLLIASLFFLGQILVGMSPVDVAFLGVSVVVLRGIQVARYLARHRDSTVSDKITDAEDHLSELCLHVFAKGWTGALIMYFFVELEVPLIWVYLGWSWAYDVFLRDWLWGRLGGRVKSKVLARAASRHSERQQRPVGKARRRSNQPA
jgi:hypothetical protein